MTDQQYQSSGPGWDDQDRGGTRWALWAVGVIAVVAIVVAAVFFLTQGGAEPVEEAPVAEVASAPPAMTGETVSVTGEVDELLSESALTMSDSETEQSLLVLLLPTAVFDGAATTLGGTQPLTPMLPPDGPLRVIGTIETFEREALSEEYGLVLHEDLFGSWEGSSVLLANQVDTFVQPTGAPTDEGDLEGDEASPAPAEG